MYEIYNAIKHVSCYSGNQQIEVLSQYKHNDTLKQILEYTYDPHRKYKIDEAKYDRIEVDGLYEGVVPIDGYGDWLNFKSYLDPLSELKSAKDEDIKSVKSFIEQRQYPNLYKMILFKDLRLNMNIKKIQKVWPDFCVEPQVQLALAKEDRAEFELSYYSRKFDGKRQWIKNKIPYSRSNKQCSIPPIKHILDQLDLLPLFVHSCVLDGECLYFENGVENFQKGISLCQKDNRTEGCENICYVIFDIIPKEQFMAKIPYVEFKTEYEHLLELVDETKESPCYSLLPTAAPNIFVARQDTDMSKLAQLMTENNWEGLMCRDGNSPYEYKRTNKLLKIKQMHDTEVVLTSMEEGTGKHAGRLGAFHANYKGYDLKIGSGFTDEQREEYWNNKDLYIGKTVKVQYFEETTNQQGEESLRFPVFLCFRNPDTNEEFLKI